MLNWSKSMYILHQIHSEFPGFTMNSKLYYESDTLIIQIP